MSGWLISFIARQGISCLRQNSCTASAGRCLSATTVFTFLLMSPLVLARHKHCCSMLRLAHSTVLGYIWIPASSVGSSVCILTFNSWSPALASSRSFVSDRANLTPFRLLVKLLIVSVNWSKRRIYRYFSASILVASVISIRSISSLVK